jgi:hypothetical protein
MGRTACTEPQCLYKGALYTYLQHRGQQRATRNHSSSNFLIRVPDIVRTTLISTLYAKELNAKIISPRRWQLQCLPKCLTTLASVHGEIPKSGQSKVKIFISGWFYERLTIVSFCHVVCYVPDTSHWQLLGNVIVFCIMCILLLCLGMSCYTVVFRWI